MIIHMNEFGVNLADGRINRNMEENENVIIEEKKDYVSKCPVCGIKLTEENAPYFDDRKKNLYMKKPKKAYKQCKNKKCTNPFKTEKGMLPTTMFYRNKANNDGLSGWCKMCQRKKGKEFRRSYGIGIKINDSCGMEEWKKSSDDG